MDKINESKKLIIFQLVLIFLILLVANYYTPYICDDFYYMRNCATGETLGYSLPEHIDSIIFHSANVNGRYIAHFVAQYMLVLPKMVFNILNAVMFTLQVFLCYLLCRGKSKENNILLLGLFGATWVYEPLVGQTNLWIMGSCNYLWALVSVLAFIAPICHYYRDGEKLNSPLAIAGYLILSFIAGAFNEAASATGIFVTIGILLILFVVRKEKIPWYFIVAVAIAICGYLTMIFAPAELNAKGTSFSLYKLKTNFVTCVEMYKGFIPVLVVYIIALFMALSKKANKKDLALSGIMLFASLFANFIFIFAAYYPGHGAGTSLVFLLIATGILVHSLYKKEERQVSLILPALIVPLMCYNLVIGLNDIHFTYYQAKLTSQYVEECKEQGMTSILYPEYEAKTTYSAYYGMQNLNHEDPQGWPNSYIAKYYDVDEVVGVDSIRDIPEIQEIAWE